MVGRRDFVFGCKTLLVWESAIADYLQNIKTCLSWDTFWKISSLWLYSSHNFMFRSSCSWTLLRTCVSGRLMLTWGFLGTPVQKLLCSTQLCAPVPGEGICGCLGSSSSCFFGSQLWCCPQEFLATCFWSAAGALWPPLPDSEQCGRTLLSGDRWRKTSTHHWKERQPYSRTECLAAPGRLIWELMWPGWCSSAQRRGRRALLPSAPLPLVPCRIADP